MNIHRRQFLLAAIGGAVSCSKKPSTAPVLDTGFARVTQIADGVYATIADASKGEQCASNGGVIVGRDAALIVEGHMQPAGAALEIEAAGIVSKAPVRGAVDTHFHLDHTFGNIAYAKQGIPILAHEKVTPLMKQQYAAVKGTNFAPHLAALEQKVAQASSAAERKHKQQDLDAAKWTYDAINATTLAYPTESLSSADLPKRIELGGLDAVIDFLPGHTPTDLIINVPERNVVFTGDLLFHKSYPVAIDADMIAWRGVLDRLAAFSPRTQFIPGHGPVCGREMVLDQCALFDDLRTHAENMLRTGATAEEAERRYEVPKRYQDYDVYWGYSVGAAMRSYFAGLGKSRLSQ